MSAEDLTGKTIASRYYNLQRLGAGGMGVVYRARCRALDRDVAIKVLRRELCSSPEQRRRFELEAKAAASVQSDHVVVIYDFGRTQSGLVYFVMEYLEGETLHARIEREQQLPWHIVRMIALQLCEALMAFHEQGILHRDVKPANCFLVEHPTNSVHVKLLDFGIAKHVSPSPEYELTGLHELLGTPRFMAPEYINGHPPDQRVDVYALGVVMYCALTGTPPFRGLRPQQILNEMLTDGVRPASERSPDAGITPAIDELLQAAMHLDPDRRLRSVAALADAINAIDDYGCETYPLDFELSQVAHVDELQPTSLWPGPPPRARARASTTALIGSSLVAMGLGAALMYAWSPQREPQPEPPPALLASADTPTEPVRDEVAPESTGEDEDGARVCLPPAERGAPTQTDAPPSPTDHGASDDSSSAPEPDPVSDADKPPAPASSDAPAESSRAETSPRRAASPRGRADPPRDRSLQLLHEALARFDRERVRECKSNFKTFGEDTVRFRLRFAPDGALEELAMSRSYNRHGEYSRCVRDALRRARWPRFSGDPLEFDYVFDGA